MRIIATLTVCLLVTGILHGQTVKNNTKQKPRSGNAFKKVVYGVIKDDRRRPFAGISAFVYAPDSTILASATTDADGRFQTNGVLPGAYFIKIIYPNRTTSIIYGFTIKEDLELNLNMSAPESDTMIKYEAVAPKKIAGKVNTK